MSNMGLYKALDAAGIGYEQTQVGDKYVAENMFENGYILGGEQSGHIIFSKHATTGDGILTSLEVMEAILETKQSLSNLRKDFKIFPQLLENIKVDDKDRILNSPAVKAVSEEVTKELPHKEISSLNHKRTSGIPAENSGVIHLAGPRRRIRIRSG